MKARGRWTGVKPLSELYTGWQEMLAEHRQLMVEVQEIAQETG